MTLIRNAPTEFRNLGLARLPQRDDAVFTPRTFVQPGADDTIDTETAVPTDVPAPTPPAPPDFQPAPPPPSIDLKAERKAAWEEGFAAATQQANATRDQQRAQILTEAREQASQEIAEIRDIFAAAVTHLTTTEHDLQDRLTAELETAIKTLAAQRAGQKIDETPRPFLRRIEKIARELAAGVEGTIVQMNPADLLAIKPHLKGFSPLSQAKLSPDPKLGRGDLRIRMADITFADVMAERQNGSLA